MRTGGAGRGAGGAHGGAQGGVAGVDGYVDDLWCGASDGGNEGRQILGFLLRHQQALQQRLLLLQWDAAGRHHNRRRGGRSGGRGWGGGWGRGWVGLGARGPEQPRSREGTQRVGVRHVSGGRGKELGGGGNGGDGGETKKFELHHRSPEPACSAAPGTSKTRSHPLALPNALQDDTRGRKNWKKSNWGRRGQGEGTRGRTCSTRAASIAAESMQRVGVDDDLAHA